jgi:sortase (surface protein transpeptidase)
MVAVLAHVIFEEDITVRQILGGLLIITGLIVVSFQKYRENKAAQLQQMILLAQEEEKNNESNKEHKKKEKKVAVDKEHLLPSNPEENEMTDTSTDINIDMDEQQVPLEDDYDQQQNEGSSFSVNIVDNETEVENGRI